MTEPAKKPEPALEADPVWDLVDKAHTQPASAHFARKTMQLVREREKRQSWWQKLMKPTPIVGLAAAAAAIALVVSLNFPGNQGAKVTSFKGEQVEAIQDALETEMLMAAADNPAEFSDQELVYRLGF
jgi:energy-converting hydrogenase Eha subunit A